MPERLRTAPTEIPDADQRRVYFRKILATERVDFHQGLLNRKGAIGFTGIKNNEASRRVAHDRHNLGHDVTAGSKSA